MARRPLIAGNWKMNLGPAAAATLAHGLRSGLADVQDVDVVVFPSPLALAPVVDVLAHTGIGVGVQHFRPEAKGAFTGETSLAMAAEAGAGWALIGHSERRALFGMTDEDCRTALEACNDERDELFCKYLWDGGTELVWAEDERGALVQVERTVVPDITRIVDGTDPASK